MNEQQPSELDHWDSDTPVWVPFRSSSTSR